MRTAGEAKLAAGDEGPKAINLKENNEVSESQENQLTDQMDIGESSLSKIDDNSFKNKERDCSSKTIEIEFEEEEKKISEGSLDSDSFRHWSKIIEESKFSTEERNFDPEELNRQLLYTKFQSDPEFQKSTSEIIKKIVSFHKEKEIIECTSHIKTVNNLIFLHLKRLIKTNKVLDIDSKTQMEYYYYIFEKTINLGLFTWEVFNDWRRNNCRTFEAMNKYWMVTVNWNNLNANSNSASNKGSDGFLLEDPIAKLLNEDFYKAERFNLLQSKYWVTNKPKYLSNIKKIIEYYAKSRKWSNKEMDLILKKNKSDIHVFSKLVELKLITEKNNILTFKEKEIKKYCDQNNF